MPHYEWYRLNCQYNKKLNYCDPTSPNSIKKGKREKKKIRKKENLVKFYFAANQKEHKFQKTCNRKTLKLS